MATFSQQVEVYTKAYKKRLRATAKLSVEKTVEMAQHPRGDGGRMRVKYGFLRGSIAGQVGSMPSGESEHPGEAVPYSGDNVEAAIVRWNPDQGETLFIGWTANYARYREAVDGFMRGATERWDQTVAEVARKVKNAK